jgi:hypothetical protein
MLRRKRRWEEVVEDDPGAGLLNLFDVWIAFAVALLLAMISYYNRASQDTMQAQNTAALRQMEQLKAKGVKVDRYRATSQQLTGEGERLGTAYRLATGEVVYIPETKPR